MAARFYVKNNSPATFKEALGIYYFKANQELEVPDKKTAEALVRDNPKYLTMRQVG